MLLVCIVTGCPSTSNAERQASGRDLFGATCARCHGSEGGGGLPLWEGGVIPANFRKHAFHAERSDSQLRKTIVEGKPPGMPAFGTTFTEPQLNALVAYVRTLDEEARK